MSKERTIFITGVTGSIGSWMARTILGSGRNVLALTRASGDETAWARTQNALAVVGAATYPGHLEVRAGDICDGDLCDSLAADLTGVSLIVNCAGVLEFGPEYARLNHQVNVQGTENLLRLAATLDVPFCHFSTAYISGTRQDRVFENQIDVGQAFHNPYESTKCQAELLVRQWSDRTGLDAFIFRPSIVVGDSRQGRIVNFDGFYNFMRLLDNIAGTLANEEFRVAANPIATKNFVPVDYVTQAAWHIINTKSPGTYHLTNPQPMPLSVLRDILVELFAIPGARFVDDSEFATKPAGKLERVYQKTASVYAPYMNAEPVFDRTYADAALRDSNIGIDTMDLAFFRKLLVFARCAQWGKSAPSVSAGDSTRERLVGRYFTRFLKEKMHRQLLPNLKNLSATCRIVVEDLPSQSWSLGIDHGRLERISDNGMDCQCTFLLRSDTFSAIVSGRLKPQRAFFEKKVDIQGDIETGLKLTTVLAAFFQKWPYSGETCHVG